jgi:hypothetical protein
MDAVLRNRSKFELGVDITAELVIWELPTPVRGSRHNFKYRLALIASGVCVLRYDNEAGKGDHRHLGDREFPYDFVDPDQLEVDFWEDVQRWLVTSRN